MWPCDPAAPNENVLLPGLAQRNSGVHPPVVGGDGDNMSTLVGPWIEDDSHWVGSIRRVPWMTMCGILHSPTNTTFLGQFCK